MRRFVIALAYAADNLFERQVRMWKETWGTVGRNS